MCAAKETALQVNEETEALKNEIAELKASIVVMKSQHEDLETNIENSRVAVINLEAAHGELRTIINDLSSRTNFLEQFVRRSDLEIMCVREFMHENLIGIVLAIGRVIGCNVQESHIISVKRTGIPQRYRPRSIVVNFITIRLKNAYLSAYHRFNKQYVGYRLTNLHINVPGPAVAIHIIQHLSPINRELFKATKQKAKEKDYMHVWVRAGKVFMRKGYNTKDIIIENQDSLVHIT